MNTVQTVVCFAALLAIAYSACPTTWIEYNGNCYHFEIEIQNWANARLICKWHNSDLVVIETAAEQEWFRKQALTFNHTNQDDGFWLGSTIWTGEWIWEPTGKPLTYSTWGQGQPNNRNGTEKCLASMKYFDYIWSDEYCNWERLGYVCEMPEPSDPLVG